MTPALQRAWLRRGPLALLLWPLSLVYGLATAMDRRIYRSGGRPRERAGVPVVVVGNVVAGGAGKTPVVMALVQHLQARGLVVGVVSRGYGRTGDDCVQVLPSSDASDVGDEPLLISKVTGAPVFVAARRAEAARALLAARPRVQLIVCDDGLQHHALHRDIEVCVFDERGTGNGWLLPAGPLRERWPRPVDLVLRTAGSGIDGYLVQRSLAAAARNADGATIAFDELARGPVLALAGIAQPQVFFDMLRARGLALEQTWPLSDHADLREVALALPADAVVVCTEKDAVKLWPQRPQTWAAKLTLDIDAAFWPAFDRLVDAKLSSRHGSQTA